MTTQRHEQREGIRNLSDELFRLFVESVKDYAIFILDPGGRIATWNRGAERIKGYKPADIIGQHFSIFYPKEAVAAGMCDYALAVAEREGRFEAEGLRVRSDGSQFWASVTITALRDASGTLLGFGKVTRDLTERKQAEENQRALAAKTAALEEKARIQEFQERFLAVLGHDLRNPLASMDMGSALLRQRAVDPTMLRVIDRMDRSSRRMTRMIEQILDLTRSRLDGIEINVAPMNLCDTLTAIVDELRPAHPTRVMLLRCPPLFGMWDGDRLEQVFSNLIGNALVHGDEKEPVTVDARAEGRTAVVDVHNEGPPIPVHVQSSLFDPFRRGDRESRTSKTAGLGLGLYISHEIVGAHGGTIEIHSAADEGTTFRVTLPGLGAVESRPAVEP